MNPMTNLSKTQWVRVSRAEPCVVCGHTDWCGRSADGTVARCSRIESEKESRGKDGAVAWIHVLSEPLPSVEVKEKPAPVGKAEWNRRMRQMCEHPDGSRRREELSASLGVSVPSLEALGVGVGYDHTGEMFFSFPERDERWQVTGIKRRYANGSQKHMVGAKPGLSMAREWMLAPGPVFLPEGGSDVAALLTLGLCAVGRPSNTGGVEVLIRLLRDLRHKPIVVLGENDRKPDRIGKELVETKDIDGLRLCPRNCEGCQWCWPGRYGAQVTAQRLTNAFGRRVYYRMIAEAKDAREWLQKYGAGGYQFVRSLKVPESWLSSVAIVLRRPK